MKTAGLNSVSQASLVVRITSRIAKVCLLKIYIPRPFHGDLYPAVLGYSIEIWMFDRHPR